jgi:hypothetical protein
MFLLFLLFLFFLFPIFVVVFVSAPASHRNQTGGLQGLYNVSCDGLADHGLGAGSGWQEKCWSSLMQPFSKKACVTATAQCVP